MKQTIRPVLFLLFFLSGFCGLAYQVVWTRVAFASFGIIMPVLSVVLSVFMLGLSLGSWAGGRWIGWLTNKTGFSAIYFYAATECLIGLSAFAIPGMFALGERVLLNSGETDSLRYLCLSALVLAISILPWCTFMGATFPFMIAFIREKGAASPASFSFLYLANVLGAMFGVFATAVDLIEVLGFRHTLWVAAACNFTVAIISISLGRARGSAQIEETTIEGGPAASPAIVPVDKSSLIKWILFSTGLIAMAMEVIWTRTFTPVLKTTIYSFAAIVFTYLGATSLGSWKYRRDLKKQRVAAVPHLMALLAITVLLPVLANNPHLITVNVGLDDILLPSALVLLASICPFCAVLGYLTPGLVDRYSGGNPADAGRAYAINVVGCIIGPLLACYLLLPWLNERYALILLGLPFFAFYWFLNKLPSPWQRPGLPAVMLIVLVCALGSDDYESYLLTTDKSTEVRRDYAATVVSCGEGFNRLLLVNGMGMTILTPITKFAAHLPLAYHAGPPKTALVICFGMGTTYRSALSWNVETTTVELVPSVTRAFGFYFADAASVLANPKGTIVIDDGRRYLARTSKKFDVIIVDPPPPVQAAACSLLMSKEFYTLAGNHLNPGGILQVWYPGNEMLTSQAAVRSVCESFPYVRVFPSLEGWGIHILASRDPIEDVTPGELAARFPESAKNDLLEWAPDNNLTNYLGQMVSREASALDLEKFLNPDRGIQITDDRPYNEYFLMRKFNEWANQ